MDKKVLDTIADAEARLVVSKIIDTANLALKYQESRFSHFLDPATANMTRKQLRFDAGLEAIYWGGYADAERQMLCVRPDWMEGMEAEFPIALFRLTGYGISELSHRDYLGSLMGLGIRREMIGDIIANEDAGYFFACEEIARYIECNLERAGRVAVKLERIQITEFEGPQRKTEAMTISVMSMRLDAILAASLRLSRSKAAELIKLGRVQINHQECSNLSAILAPDDLISVRGFGRLRLSKVGGTSKKGRIFLEMTRYV